VVSLGLNVGTAETEGHIVSVLKDGKEDIIINMPSSSAGNVSEHTCYSFALIYIFFVGHHHQNLDRRYPSC
jgi:hypothetical protein